MQRNLNQVKYLPLAGHASPIMTAHYETGYEIIWNDIDVEIKLLFAHLP
ncbi:hypothetical protein [Acinetobacter sp. ANC 4648]|nr:hypothetical protein [Acinetobacter sp. ANC 4648]